MNTRRTIAAWGLLLGAAQPCRGLIESTAPAPVWLGASGAAARPAPTEIAAAFASRVSGGWRLEWSPQLDHVTAGELGFAPARAAATPAEVASRAAAFVERTAAFTGAAAAVLVRARTERAGHAWHVTWTQSCEGLPVWDAWLDLTLRADGEVVAFTSTLARSLDAPVANWTAGGALRVLESRWGNGLRLQTAALVVVPGDEVRGARRAWHLDVRRGVMERWDVLVDATDGTLLRAENRVHTIIAGTCTVEAQPAYAQDAATAYALPWTRIALAGNTVGSTFGDGTGRFQFAVESPSGLRVGTELRGRFLNVGNAAGEPAANAATDVPPQGPAAVHLGAASGRLDERTIYVHANRIHDDVGARFDFRLLDFAMPAVAGEPGLANAFWDGDGIHFGDGGNTFFNLGLFADVIYHEYTHGITDYMYRPFGGLDGAEGGALHEALSDYFACTLTDEPLVGENLYRDGGGQSLRNLDNTLVWPRDRRGEVHADGEIFAGALWDLRRTVGPAVADVLVHFARNLGPKTFAAYANAVRLQDDLQFGDGNADNGSPHAAEILVAFERHGFGPGLAAGRRLLHRPLTDTERPSAARRVVAGFEGHLSAGADVLQLFYSTGGAFSVLPMQRLADGDFAADIPAGALTDGAVVRYYVRLVPRRGVPVQTLPALAPAAAFEFRVGADHEPPVIEHSGTSESPAFAWPASLRARIHDNQAVAYAYVETWRDGVPDARLGMVRDAGDPESFLARFPNVGGAGSVFEYRILAVDAAAVANTRCWPNCDRTFRITLVPSWDESFETGTGGFEHASGRAGHADAWQLGLVPGGPASRGWRVGSDTEEYAPGLVSALFTPAAAVAAGGFATIRSWIDAEPNGPGEAFDAGVAQIEVDGDNVWRPLAPDGGYPRIMAETAATNVLLPGTPCWSGRDATWRALRFDLNAWAGHHVRLRFLFTSDGTPSPFGYRGWALDDFHFDPGAQDPSAAPGGDVGAGPARLTWHQNPARPGTEFDLWIPAGSGAARLAFFDVRGRRVRGSTGDPGGPGWRPLVWDGIGDGGVALPSGVYYYRLDTSRGSAHGRFVFVR